MEGSSVGYLVEQVNDWVAQSNTHLLILCVVTFFAGLSLVNYGYYANKKAKKKYSSKENKDERNYHISVSYGLIVIGYVCLAGTAMRTALFVYDNWIK